MAGVSILCFVVLAAYLVLGWKKPAIAFTTLPFSLAVVWYIAVVTDAPENLLLMIPTIFIGTLVAIVASGRGGENRPWFYRMAWYLLIGIASILLGGVFLVGVGAMAGGFVLAAVFLCSIIAVCVPLIYHALTGGRRTVVNVLSTLAAAVRQNLPLPMALDCAAIGEEYGTSAVLHDIKTWLVKGCSLTDALRQGYPGCPAEALAMIAAGERIGQLPAALAAVETDMKAQTLGPKRLRPVHPFYPAFVVVLVVLLITGLMTFILPQLASVSDELVGGKLPAPTRILVTIGREFGHGSIGAILFFAVVLTVAGRRIYRAARQRPDRPSAARWLGDSLLWFLPVARWFQQDHSLVRTLELLRFSLTAGCPVNDAIRATLDLDVNWWFRKRLRRWLDRVERGENIAESARRCGLGRSLVWAFGPGVNTGDTPAVLAMLESYHRSLYLYRLNVIRHILWPVGILTLGLMVGFVAYAMFAPAVAITDTLVLNVYP